MKKLVKWASIIIGILLVVLTAGIIALPFILPLEKIKDLAAAKISETINREVKIEKISFNLFEGIKLNGLTISNRKGFTKKPFISADSIVLRYAFWPIFKRQIIVKEISLVKPEILVEKNAAGEFNFSDMSRKKTRDDGRRTTDDSPNATDKRKAQFSLIVDAFSIKKGRITYADYGTKQTSEIKNANLTISGITLALLKPIELKCEATANYQGKDIPLSAGGKIKLDLAKQSIELPSFTLDIAGERAAITARVSHWKTGPSVDLTLSSKKLSIDPLLAIFAAADQTKPKQKLARGELTKKVDKATASIKPNYKVRADLAIDNLTFKNFKVDKIALEAALSNKQLSANIKEVSLYEGKLSGKANVNLAASGLAYNIQNLKLKGFNSTPFVNTMVEAFLTNLPDYKDLLDKVYGRLSAAINLRGRGVEPQDIFANAVGEGSFTLTEGEIKRMKTLAAVGKIIKSASLQEDMKFKDLHAEFALDKRILTAKNLLLEDKDIKAVFNGSVDLGNLLWVPGNRLVISASPAITQGVPQEFSFFRNNAGWVELTFEITGSLKMPVPKPVLDKPIEAAIGKIKAKIEAKKVEIEQQTEEELKKKEEEAKQAAEAEKKRLEEEAKKKLKELIKF